MARKPYPSDVTDAEWSFVAPYLTLMTDQAPQRKHSLRTMYNALRWMVRAGAPWRMMPHEFPPWHAVYDQAQRWIKAGVFEQMAQDLREILRLLHTREPQPSAVILDSRTLQSTPESGSRAGYDGAKRKKGSKIHIAVDTLGHLLAMHVTPASEQDRQQVGELAQQVQQVTGESVKLAYVDQGYTGQVPQEAAAEQGMALEVVKLPYAKRGFILLPKRWVVERSLAWMARFRRLAKDYERLADTVKGLHFASFVCLLLGQLMKFFATCVAGSA